MRGEGFVAEIIDLFLLNAPRRIAGARAAWAAWNLEGITFAAESLRGSAGNMGASTLRDLAARTARAAEEGRVDSLPPLLDALDEEFGRVRRRLEAER